MRGDEIALRNAAILAALRRGENLHRVAQETQLAASTVRVIAMGGGLTLTPGQRTDPDPGPAPDQDGAATAQSPRRPESFQEHLRRFDRRNAAILEGLKDPDRSVTGLCQEFGLNEATILRVGWHAGAWKGTRRPQGQDRTLRDAAVQDDIRAGASSGELTKRWGLSTTHLRELARAADLPTPTPPQATRGRRSRAGARDRKEKLAADLTAGMSLEAVCDKHALASSTVVTYAREQGISVARPPRRPRAPSARNQDLVRRAQAGETFTELAEAFNISRERVRQIVLASAGTTAQDLAEQRLLRQALAKEERLGLLAADRPEMTCHELGKEVGLPTERVVTLLGAVEAARRAPLSRPRDFDVPTLVREMRRIYRLGSFKPLRRATYDKHRRRHAASSAAAVQKFGSWESACQAAQIRVPEPSQRTYSRQWTRDRCLAWVAAFLREGASVRATDFAAWLEARDGPSAATVNGRCGTWGDTLRAAAELASRPAWQPPPTPLRSTSRTG